MVKNSDNHPPAQSMSLYFPNHHEVNGLGNSNRGINLPSSCARRLTLVDDDDLGAHLDELLAAHLLLELSFRHQGHVLRVLGLNADGGELKVGLLK